ncbi:MAG: SGNH/GDSL hydrolase family protein [Bacteroidales bacterium]|nr:SGNH/GDSL hydrolase family protein [Bacteroidales bacterium]
MREFDPIDVGAEVHGNGWESLAGRFVRLEDSAEGLVRKPVWDLSRNSAGLSLVFRSNTRRLELSFDVFGWKGMNHMPATGVSGVDLFAYKPDGEELWCAAKFMPQFKEEYIEVPATGSQTATAQTTTAPSSTPSSAQARTVRVTRVAYSFEQIDYEEGCEEYEWHLYLPLYNTVENFRMAVEEGCRLEWVPRDERQPIVVYGTSIAQGACATRPGMAWTNLVERELRYPVVNLGFSGNGKLEAELFALLDQIDAGVYIIDCLPNIKVTDNFEEKLEAGIKLLREHHSCPILVVDHSGHTNDRTNLSRCFPDELNRRQAALVKRLRKEGIKQLYYLTRNEIAWDKDSMVEGIHPNDRGMMQQAEAVCGKLRQIDRRCRELNLKSR